MTPAEISGRLKAHEAQQKHLLEGQDMLAWLVGAYVGTAVNNPKRYPRKPDRVRIQQAPKPAKEMDSESLKDVLITYAEIHNAIEGAKT